MKVSDEDDDRLAAPDQALERPLRPVLVVDALAARPVELFGGRDLVRRDLSRLLLAHLLFAPVPLLLVL